ncbi:MAG: hypothetical protein HY908_35250 [Myxococcales bacterium]|nr:hypothetical protein [Myxococcales bacterium]
MSLAQALSEPDKRSAVVDDCCTLVDREVSKKSGFSGVIIKAGYRTVKGIKPGFIRKVVDSLLDEWATGLDPIWSEAQQAPVPLEAFAAEHERVAEALLGVTDAKSKNAKSAIVRSTYDKLRPSAKRNVEEAVPELGALLAKHVG